LKAVLAPVVLPSKVSVFSCLFPHYKTAASCVRFEQQNERRVSAIFFRIDPQVRPSFSEGGGFVVEGLG
jgi:hypothetical protein